MISDGIDLDLNRAAELLGVSVGATDHELRAAYVQKVRLHPPDREPEIFERIRDAYDHLRDPNARAMDVLKGPDPDAPLTALLDGQPSSRVFVGSRLWIELLKEKRS